MCGQAQKHRVSKASLSSVLMNQPGRSRFSNWKAALSMYDSIPPSPVSYKSSILRDKVAGKQADRMQETVWRWRARDERWSRNCFLDLVQRQEHRRGAAVASHSNGNGSSSSSSSRVRRGERWFRQEICYGETATLSRRFICDYFESHKINRFERVFRSGLSICVATLMLRIA